MDQNDPQAHILQAIGHLKPVQKSGGGEYPIEPAQCYRAQAEALIAIAMCLSGIGAKLEEISQSQGRGGRGPFGTIRS